MYEENSFTGRLNQLYTESGLSIEKFAKKCNVSGSAMQNYLSGSRLLPSEKVIDVCNAFTISADWLLGLSDAKSIETDVQIAVKTLGLSEKAVDNVIHLHGKDFEGGLSALLESEDFLTLTYDYADFRRCLKRISVKKPPVFCAWKTNEDGSITVDPDVAIDLFGSQVVMDMSRIINYDKDSYIKKEMNRIINEESHQNNEGSEI